MKLSRNEDVICGWCGAINTLGKWSDLTYSKCTNREMKRAFQPLTDSKAFMKNTKSYYICPDCGKWSKGSQLKIINSDNDEVSKLGGDMTMLSILGGNSSKDNNNS